MTYSGIKNTSYIASIGFHALLFVIFFFWKLNINVPATDFVEIGFGNPGGSGGGGNDISHIQKTAATPEKNIQEQIAGQQSLVKKDDKAKIEQIKVTTKDEEKIVTKAKKETQSTVQTGTNKADNASNTGNKALAGYGSNPSGSGIGDGHGNGSGDGYGEGNGTGDGYDIDWGGRGNRKIYSYAIPAYPDGVSKVIDVKLKFTILPDGTVGTIIPLIKADIKLETAAINSLRQWRFEPLSQKQKRQEQTAVIIFPFRLQ
ncbi:MAG: energy transducer TonB [Ignavibacteria bacterium]